METVTFRNTPQSDAEGLVLYWLRQAEIKLANAIKIEGAARAGLTEAVGDREYAETQLRAAELILTRVKVHPTE